MLVQPPVPVTKHCRTSTFHQRVGHRGVSVPVLRIQHVVPDFNNWKRAFDGDPMDRKGSGVRRYHVFRAVEDQNLVMIDLELNTMAEAERMLERLGQLWAGPGLAEPSCATRKRGSSNMLSPSSSNQCCALG